MILATLDVVTGMTENDQAAVVAKLDGERAILRAVVRSRRENLPARDFAAERVRDLI